MRSARILMFPSVNNPTGCIHIYRTLEEASKRLHAAGGRGDAAGSTRSLLTSRLEPVRGPNLIARVWNLARTAARQREGAGIPCVEFPRSPPVDPESKISSHFVPPLREISPSRRVGIRRGRARAFAHHLKVRGKD